PIYLAAKSATETAQGNSQTKTPTLTVTATSVLSATPTPEVPSLYIDPNLPASFQTALQLEAAGFVPSEGENATVRLAFGAEAPISQWIYALVAPFPTVTDGINATELQAFWQEASPTVYFDRLILGKSSYKAIESLWGMPAGTVEVHADADLLNLAWNTPGTWAIIPFEEIQPRWKVIALDKQSPLHKDFMPEIYSLTVPISLVAIEGNSTDTIAESLKPNLAQTNRDADKLATVILTGVTALVRGTAREMEKLGITRPAEVIGQTLRDADILHISNEVPFAVNCGEPAPQNIDKLIFCSKDEYVELLKAVGTDVVELTGDHFEDWGPEAMLHTLELYKELGWLYYGGGRNLEEAKQPLKLEVNGNKIAFLGCNAKEWIYSNATETKPGNFHCDWDYMAAEVKQLRAEGYLPIVTFQHNEYYVWEAQSQLVEDFHRMEAAGAVIVSG
ncbi:MAG TPA: CapA family protein, partial [Anaerolineaceae bacterium]|nr:CapA family protein [Anaerolineaceae bacterium]